MQVAKIVLPNDEIGRVRPDDDVRLLNALDGVAEVDSEQAICVA